jgi:uncharacterized protein (TIGR02266 family)
MTKDERRHQRVPLAMKIRFKSATISEFIEQYSRDLSKGGIFIRMKSPMPVGTLIKFDFRLQDERSLIQGVGRVVWRREDDSGDDAPSGMGIKFIKLDENSRGNLERIIEGQPTGGVSTGEEPDVETVEDTGEEPEKGVAPIAPVRPQSVPRSAKRTMIGMGMGPTPSAPKAAPEKEEEPAEDKEAPAADEPAAAEEAAPVAEEPAADAASADADESAAPAADADAD